MRVERAETNPVGDHLRSAQVTPSGKSSGKYAGLAAGPRARLGGSYKPKRIHCLYARGPKFAYMNVSRWLSESYVDSKPAQE
jgi:hypothetical protein